MRGTETVKHHITGRGFERTTFSVCTNHACTSKNTKAHRPITIDGREENRNGIHSQHAQKKKKTPTAELHALFYIMHFL